MASVGRRAGVYNVGSRGTQNSHSGLVASKIFFRDRKCWCKAKLKA